MALSVTPLSAIINGQQADAGEYPFVVLVMDADIYAEEGVMNAQLCGATLIAPQWVLTAAHCVNGEGEEAEPSYLDIVSPVTRKIYAGSHTLQQGSGTVVNVESIYINGYNPDTKKNDIALIKLASPIEGVDPVNIPAAPYAPESAGTLAWVVGWGITTITDSAAPDQKILREVEIPIQSDAVCKAADPGLDYGADSMCAGITTDSTTVGGKGACSGDSGGPLMVKKGDAWVQVGVVSHGGDLCNADGNYGFFSRVSANSEWVANTAGVALWSETASGGENPVDYRDFLASKSFDISGTFGQYDFTEGYANGDNAFDWAFVAADGTAYQLRGTKPGESSVFGWKAVQIPEIEPLWFMFYAGADIDGDGTSKFDWFLVSPTAQAAYKLEGVNAAGTFEYSQRLELGYAISGDESSVTFGNR